MTEVKQYKCPFCAAELKYSPDNHKFTCEYCLGEFDKDQITDESEKAAARENDSKPLDEEFENSASLYTCPSCGAEIISDSNTAASVCCYCHNPVILSGRVSGKYRPSKILPFEFGKEKSAEIFRNWAKKKWFLPRDFLSDNQIEKLSGLYVPFWVTDSKTSVHMNAVGTKTRSWKAGNYRYTEHSEFSVVRDASVSYTGIPADGSRKIDDRIMEAVEPFDYSKAKDFSMSYMSGFLADKYDVDRTQVFPRIKSRIEENNIKLVKSSACYDSLKILDLKSSVNHIDWQYMMLPVWFLTYSYKGKMYEFAINGQSGKISGMLPLSLAKLISFCTAAAVIAAVLLTAGGMMFW